MIPTVSRPPVPGVRPIIPPVIRPAVPNVTPTEKPQTTVYIGKIAPTVDNDFMLSLLRVGYYYYYNYYVLYFFHFLSSFVYVYLQALALYNVIITPF